MHIGQAWAAVMKVDIDLFEGAEQADKERRPAIGTAAVAAEIRGAELSVAGNHGATHGPILVRALGPGLVVG